MTTTYRVLQALMGFERGRHCRRCDEAILADDHFGLSEGVCRSCRREAA
jgi:hypothetical protein